VRIALLNIDISHIGDREMTRLVQHVTAAVVAVLVMATSFSAVVSVPASYRTGAAAPALG
jgi:hypothetical protein